VDEAARGASPLHEKAHPDDVPAGGKARRSTAPFAWREAIGFGLGVLRLSPDAFWRMTPRELALAAEALLGPRVRPLGRAAFADLMRRYPDGR
jgi:uncharacterized phage protein (TIGR02216 family)